MHEKLQARLERKLKILIWREREQEFPSKLENSQWLDTNLTVEPCDRRRIGGILTELVNILGLSITPKHGKTARNNLKCLILNLLHVREINENRYLIFSRGCKSYGRAKNSKCPTLTDGIIGIADMLAKHGYTKRHGGTNNGQNIKGNRASRIQATPKLVKLFEGIEPDRPIGELVRLRDADKNDIPRKKWKLSPEDKEKIRDFRYEIERINNLNGQGLWRYEVNGIEYRFDSRLVRIFNETFERGGRFYGGFQSFPKEQRKTITVNSDSTIELDYGGLHVRLLYDLIGNESYPLDGDPYADVLKALGLENHHTAAELRNDLKLILLAQIGGSEASPAQIVARVERRLFAPQHNDDVIRQSARWYNLRDQGQARRRRWESMSLDATNVLNCFDEAHRPICEQFNRGWGIRLQYLDSQIATCVMLALVCEGIACLPVHDSFITTRTRKNYLRDAMAWSYSHNVHANLGTEQGTRTYKIPIK